MWQFSQDVGSLWMKEVEVNGPDRERSKHAKQTVDFTKAEIARTLAHDGFHRLNPSHPSGPVNGPVRQIIYPNYLPIVGPKYERYNLPSFVLPLGRLHVRNIDDVTRRTTYILVMDVTNNSKGLWLIWDSTSGVGEEDNGPLAPLACDCIPGLKTPGNFYMARVAESCDSWDMRRGLDWYVFRAEIEKTRQVAGLHPSGVVFDKPPKETAREAMEAGCGGGTPLANASSAKCRTPAGSRQGTPAQKRAVGKIAAGQDLRDYFGRNLDGDGDGDAPMG